MARADVAGGGRKLGLVLGGGGVRGLAHAGVLALLDREGIIPDLIVGVSMGAVVGAAYASRPDWQEALESVDRTQLPALADPREDEGFRLLRVALRSAKRLAPTMWTWGRTGYEEFGRSTLTEIIGEGRQFADLRLPLAVVATDLVSGSRRVILSGDVISATLASAAIPGITNPVERDAETLIDGGFADPAPVDVARAMGADVVVAVYTGQHLEPMGAENWLLALFRGMEIAQRSFAEARLRDADLVLRPDFGGRVNVIDFSAVQAVVRSGASCARHRIDDIRALIDGPAGEATR